MWRHVAGIEGLWARIISAPHLDLRLEIERRVTTWRARLVRCDSHSDTWLCWSDHPTLEAAQRASEGEVRKMARALLEQVPSVPEEGGQQ